MQNGNDRQIHLMSHKSLNHYHLFNYCNLWQSFYLLHLLPSDHVIVSVRTKTSFLGSLLLYLIWLQGLWLMQISIAHFCFLFWWNPRQISKSNFHMSTNACSFLTQPMPGSMGNNGMLEHPFSPPASVSIFFTLHFMLTRYFVWFSTSRLPPPTPPPTASSVHVLSKTWPLMSLLFPHPEWAFIISPPLPELQLLYTFTTLNWLRPFHPHATGGVARPFFCNLPSCPPSPRWPHFHVPLG